MVITPQTVQIFTLEKEELEQYWQEWLIRVQRYRNFELYQQLFAND